VVPRQSPREDTWRWVHLAPEGSELGRKESAVIKANPD
jgi:hypothetical protein